MTRKDYEAIAAALASDHPGAASVAADDRVAQAYRYGYRAAIEQITNALDRDNPRFDRERFLKACGAQWGNL